MWACVNSPAATADCPRHPAVRRRLPGTSVSESVMAAVGLRDNKSRASTSRRSLQHRETPPCRGNTGSSHVGTPTNDTSATNTPTETDRQEAAAASKKRMLEEHAARGGKREKKEQGVDSTCNVSGQAAVAACNKPRTALCEQQSARSRREDCGYRCDSEKAHLQGRQGQVPCPLGRS